LGLAALCPGTFDPVVVAVLENPGKEPLFSLEERVAMLKEAVIGLGPVEVASFSGLLVDFARRREIGVVVKGLRAVTDFDYELQMAQMNHQMTGLETFFVPTSPQWSYLSSSLIKEVVRGGGDVSGMLPAHVLDRLREKLATGGE
jgi:pantetheine-phosphate adenylyltransferase